MTMVRTNAPSQQQLPSSANLRCYSTADGEIAGGEPQELKACVHKRVLSAQIRGKAVAMILPVELDDESDIWIEEINPCQKLPGSIVQLDLNRRARQPG